MSIRIDGLVNPALFQLGGSICALGRTHVRNDNLLKACSVFPRVNHLATIRCPDGTTFEDPNFMGEFEGMLVFICADAYEYHEYHKNLAAGREVEDEYQIYQSIVYIDPGTWTISKTLRLASPIDSRVEKNWTPIGTIMDNKSLLLYGHDKNIIITVDHTTEEASVHPMRDREVGCGIVRGGTPLINHPTDEKRLWCVAHSVIDRAGYTHPAYKYDIPKYVSVMRTYDTEFNMVDEVFHYNTFGKVIDYPRGIVVGKDGKMIVAVGIDDISSIFLNCTVDDWTTDEIPSKHSEIGLRYTYLDSAIPLHGSCETSEPTLCLNMIVKNESAVIERLLDSVIGIIDTYCICDTGSTDNTKEIIQNYFTGHNIRGRLIEFPFVDFGFNRNYALQAARDMASHVLLLDADMKLVVKPGFSKSMLTDKVYSIRQGHAGFSYSNTRIIRTDIPAECVGSTHEYYNVGSGICGIDDLWIEDIGDGGCKTDKFHRDIVFLSEDVRQNPNNARAHFYLANSYRDTRQWERAIEHYTKRIELGGWDEEVWNSFYSIGKCYKEEDKMPEAINAWLEGYNYHPQRAENIYELVNTYRNAGKNELASMFYKWGKMIPKPDAILFLHTDVYDYKLDYELTIFYYYLRNKTMYSETDIYDAFINVVSHGHMVQNVMANYKFYARKLADLGTATFLPLPLDLDLLPSIYVDSTPSCVIVDDTEILNVRYNNTVIADDWSYKNLEEREITRNICFHSEFYEGIDCLSCYQPELMSEDNPPDTNLFEGRQDIRLFNAGGNILYTASICRYRDDRRCIMMEYGEYDLVNHRLNGTCINTERDCEKNWSLFENELGDVKCVYSWYPLTVGRIEDSAFHEEYSLDVPELRLARGSSHGIVVGDELWFMTHLVSYETPRRYYHSIVATDKNVQRVIRMTYPATFEGKEIEYCGSIVLVDDNLDIYYSVRDQCSKKLSIPVEKLVWKLLG